MSDQQSNLEFPGFYIKEFASNKLANEIADKMKLAKILTLEENLFNLPKPIKVSGNTIVMKYLGSFTSLDNLINKSNFDNSLEYFSTAGQILGILHSHSIIHEDYCLNNLGLVTGSEIVYLIDWTKPTWLKSERLGATRESDIILFLISTILFAIKLNMNTSQMSKMEDAFFKGYEVTIGDVKLRKRIVLLTLMNYFFMRKKFLSDVRFFPRLFMELLKNIPRAISRGDKNYEL